MPTIIETLATEFSTDPLNLGYAGKTASEVLAIINAAGSASQEILVLSEDPVHVTGVQIMEKIAMIDGRDGTNNAFGVGSQKVIEWMDTNNSALAGEVRYFLGSAANVNIAQNDTQNLIGEMASVDMPANRNLISEEAMNAIHEMGMILLSRAREIISRSATLSEVEQALGS